MKPRKSNEKVQRPPLSERAEQLHDAHLLRRLGELDRRLNAEKDGKGLAVPLLRPHLLMRSHVGDDGMRPLLQSSRLSPDIWILPGEAETAPDLPSLNQPGWPDVA